MDHRLLIKERVEEEMWNGEQPDCRQLWAAKNRQLELESKDLRNTQKTRKMKQQHDSAPAGQCSFFFLFFPPTSFLFALCSCLSDTRALSFSSHYHSGSGTAAVHAAVNSPPPRPLEFCWAGLIWPLLYRRKVIFHLLCGDGQRGGSREQRRAYG